MTIAEASTVIDVPALLTVDEAARVLRIGRTSAYRLPSSSSQPTVRVESRQCEWAASFECRGGRWRRSPARHLMALAATGWTDECTAPNRLLRITPAPPDLLSGSDCCDCSAHQTSSEDGRNVLWSGWGWWVRQPFGVVERCTGVERGFVDQFVDLHRVAYRSAFVVVGMRADAEDMAQEALARALVRWYKVEAYAPAWVARVSTNLALDRVRANGRQRHHSVQMTADPLWEQRRDLVEALRKLPRRQREAVVLRYLVDLPEGDVALAMGCSLGTVKSSTSRGLDALRAQLGERWVVE